MSTFAGDITLDDDLNFSTNGFADISNTGTGAMRFKPSSQTLALTLTGANATFAGNITVGTNANIDNNLTVSGGNITLGGTGRIQGIDTVSATTDAANKAYVDAHGGGLGPFLPLSAGSSYPLTGTLYGTGATFGDTTVDVATVTIEGGQAGILDIWRNGTNASYQAIRFRDNTNANTEASIGWGSNQLRLNGTSTIVATTGGSERMRITSTGNVGIGTTSPSGAPYRLTIGDGDIYAQQAVAKITLGQFGSQGDAHFGASGLGSPTVGSQDYGFYSAHNAYRTSTGAWKHSRTSTIPAVRLLGSGGASSGNQGFSFDYSANVGTADITWTNLMQILPSGNVGIGTTSPVSTLEIAKNDQTNGATLSITNSFEGGSWDAGDIVGTIDFRSDDTSTTQPIRGQIKLFDDSASGSTYPAFNAMSFSTANLNVLNERMRIDSSGNVGIGTTSPSAKLDVDGVIRSRGGTYSADTDTRSDVGMVIPENDFIYTADGNDYLRKLIGKSSDIITIGESGTSLIDGINLSPGTTGGYVQILNNTSVVAKFVDGKLGLGTTSPSAKLDVAGDLRIDGYSTTTNEAGLYLFNNIAYSMASLANCNNSYNAFRIRGRNSATNTLGIGSNGDSDYVLQVVNDAGTVSGNISLNPYGGNVGIGTASPGAKLDIAAVTNAVVRLTSTGTGLGADTALGSLQFYGNDASVPGAGIKSSIVAKTEAALGDDSNLIFSTSDGTTNNIERMRIDSAGRVGIGTISPSAKLEVSSSGADGVLISKDKGTTSNSGRLFFETDTVSEGFSFLNSNGLMTIRSQAQAGATSGNVRVVINGSGNVGIGTTSPQSKLHITDSTLSLLKVQETSGNTGASAGALFKTSPNTGPSYFKGGILYEDTGNANVIGKLHLVNRVSADATNAGVGDAKLTIDTVGNVGIGTSTPLAKLDIQGTQGQLFSVTDNLSGSIFAVADISGVPIFDVNSSGVSTFAGTVTAASGTFSNLTSTKFPVAGTGGLLENSILYKLNYNAIGLDTTGRQFFGNNFHTISNAVALNLHAGLTSSVNLKGDGADILVASTGGNVNIPNGKLGIGMTTAPSYELDVAGTIRATGDVIAYSDVRVKENIKTIDNSLEKVSKLRGVEFNKIGDNKKSIGVIAQEIEKVIPEVVKEDDKGMKSVAYGNISGLLIEAIKELKAEIEELKLNKCNCNK